MSDSPAGRDFIVDFLREELVGPSTPARCYPADQLDSQEILRPQDPPKTRYAAGILFPTSSEMLSREEAASAEDSVDEVEHADEDDTPETPDSSESTEVNIDHNENPDDTDREVTLANRLLPSAMGLSALVEVPDCLRVDFSAGVYKHEELEWGEKRKNEDGIESYKKAWWRRPIAGSVPLPASELLEKGAVTLKKTALHEEGMDALELHVVSRPYPGSAPPSRTRLVTFTLVNRRPRGAQLRNQDCFFQCGFTVSDPDGAACFLSYPGRPRAPDDAEELSLQLLYSHQPTFAVGHGCAADWDAPDGDRTTSVRTEVLPTYEVKPVLPRKIPGLDLRMTDSASGQPGAAASMCASLADAYNAWIADREAEIESRQDLSVQLKDAARRHMEDCRECLRRMRDGVVLLEQDSTVGLAFRLMNEAMLMQQIHYQISTDQKRNWINTSGSLALKKPFERPPYDDPERRWYPFQLAFILMNLRAVAEPDCPERRIVDVIWFPTGGGKTEAYLGLSAFCMFLRRLRNPDHAGTSILMRYTLRLLTTQQFQRAASLICACEYIRRGNEDRLGSERFSIGLWVGTEVTPNSEKDAVKSLNNLLNHRGVNKFVILSCPWCGAAMGPQKMGRSAKCKGYRKLARPGRVRLICEDPDCDFSSDDGLPLAVIDQHIYESPPTLLIGTVDKFAMLAFRPEARSLFGVGRPWPPPELIIQDELHLISGPLGSMVGHYETVIDALCTNETQNGPAPAKIIASTATISTAGAASQVRGLYGREAFMFPPQALKAGDSFFAEEREGQVGRLYAGVFTTAVPSHTTAQTRTMAALLQAPKSFETDDPKAVDPYWTLMCYFNTLRELGYAATLIRAEIREYINWLVDRLGQGLEIKRSGGQDPRRFINRDEELTSRVPSNRIPDILGRLFNPYDGAAHSEVVDVCLATSMIQVGIDIPRLSVMLIAGQPKTTSEYIQASSRVGRQSPGIVVTNFNTFRPRDRSHYEHFRSYHQSIYRHVEPTSVTPFAVPVRERALHALVAILCRFWGDKNLRHRPNPPPNAALVSRIKETIRGRVRSADPDEWPETEARIDEIIDRWAISPPPRYGGFGRLEPEEPLMYPAGGQQHPDWHQPYPTPTSMRNVDAECSARQLRGGYGEREYEHA